MEPITGSEDRRSSDRDDPLFAAHDPEPPAFPPGTPPAPPRTAQDSQISDRLDGLERRTVAMQNRLEEVARALGLLGRRLQEQAAAAGDAAAAPSSVDDDRLRAIEHRVAAIAAMQEREIALLDGLSAALDAEGATLRMDQERVAAMLASLRDELADLELERSGVTGTAAWSDVLNRVERALSAQANRIEAVLATTRGQIGEQLDEQAATSSAAVAEVLDEVARVREVTADRLQTAALTVEQASTQVADQLASGQSAMSEHLDGVRTTLDAVTGPLGELARRTDDLATAVENSATALDASRIRLEDVDASMRNVVGAMDGFEEVIEQRLGAAAAEALTDARSELLAAREEVQSAATAAGEELRGILSEVAAQLQAAIQSAQQVAAERAQQTLDQAAQRLTAATEDATTTAARLESFEEVLAAVLVEHDQALADQRAQLVYDLVSSLADGLTKRERKRLAQKLEVPPAPQTSDMSRRLREVFELAANRDLMGLSREESGDLDEPASVQDMPDDDGVPMPKRVVRSRSPLAEIIEDDVDVEDLTDDVEPPIDADLRTRLSEIRGMPDTTRERLVAEFGSLARLQTADDDTILAVRGVGPSLLARLRDL